MNVKRQASGKFSREEKKKNLLLKLGFEPRFSCSRNQDYRARGELCDTLSSGNPGARAGPLKDGSLLFPLCLVLAC